MEPAASCSMASNRAIMPRADSTSSTVGRSEEGLPSPRTNFQTMLKVTLYPAGPRRGRLNCKVLLQFQGWPCHLHKCGHLPRTSSAEPDHGGIDRRLACSTSHFKPRSWMKLHQDSFAPLSRGRARSRRRFGHPHGPHSAAGHRRPVDYPAEIASLERLIPDRANDHNIGADLTDATGSIAS
jgi:hypothetical protein